MVLSAGLIVFGLHFMIHKKKINCIRSLKDLNSEIKNQIDFCKNDLLCHFDSFGCAQDRLWEKSFYAYN